MRRSTQRGPTSGTNLRDLGRFLILVLISGCNNSAQSPTAAKTSSDRVLRVSQGSDVLSMDPYFILESPTICVQINIFDPLTTISPEMKIVPALAESWKNINPTTWEFKLREGVKFHNGRPFDAEDVRFSLTRARDWPRSRVRSEIPTFKEVHVIGPGVLHIETTVPDAILPTRLASVLILDKETSEEGLAKEGDAWLSVNAIGTGPYRLAEWVKDSHCDLIANEEYWAGAPSVKKISFLAMSNDATRVVSFLNGDLDIICHVPAQDVERIRQHKDYRVISNPSLRLIYLGLDCARDKTPGVPNSPPNPLKDVRVRRAIYHAINEDLIIEKVMSGQAAPADQLFPEAIIGHDPSIGRLPYDPEKSRQLLAEAGYPQGFSVRLDSPNDRYVNDAKIAAAIAGQLARVGIQVEVNAIPKARFFDEERAGNCSFFLIGWSNTNGDGNGTFDHLLHTEDPQKNLGDSNQSTNYSNSEVDRLSEAAWGEFDPVKREELLRQAVRLTMNDLPHIPLHYQMDIYAVSEKVEWTPRRDTEVRGVEVRWRE